MGLRQSFGLFLQPISDDLGFGREVFSLALALQNLLFGLPLLGMVADRFGSRWVIFGGALVYAGGCLLVPLTEGPTDLHLALGLMIDAARGIGVWANDNDHWEDAFFRIFLAMIEPELGVGAPTILYDYPAPMAALSRLHPGGRLAERFEVFVCGLEIANGYTELTDAAEQRIRFERDRAQRAAHFGTTYPIDEDFMAALEAGLPDCAGIALGVDRLVMLATGAGHIEDCLLYTSDAADEGLV